MNPSILGIMQHLQNTEHSLPEQVYNLKAKALRDLSAALITIGNRDELVQTIFERLKPIFRYDAAILGVVETVTQLVTVFAHDFLPEMLRSAFFQRMLRRKFPLQGTPFEVLLQQPAPLLVTPEMAEELLGVRTSRSRCCVALGLSSASWSLPCAWGRNLLVS